MKIRKLIVVLIVMLLAYTPVQATRDSVEITPKAFAYIWPTSYETYDWHTVFMNIEYRTVLVSQPSNIAYDSCYGRIGYHIPSFIPVPLYGGQSYKDPVDPSQIDNSGPWTCTITYQYQVGLGAIDHIENPW